MKVKIEKGTASGVILAPPSKSVAHRLLICAAMANGTSTVRGISQCEDVLATLDALSALGVSYKLCGNDVTVFGMAPKDMRPGEPLRARESGSTLRFMIPIAMISGQTAIFYGAKSLMMRPMGVYQQISDEKGLTFITDGESIVVKGPLAGGEYAVSGNVSSQFISGLLFALPTLKDDSVIRIAPPVESRSYINLTISALKSFGVIAEWADEYTITIKGNQRYIPCDITVEGDWSGAAFPDALNLFGGSVQILGLKEDTLQGDSIYRKYYEMLNTGVPTLHIGDCPDLGPVMFAIAAAKHGAVFSGTRRLKIKESDRAAAMADELKKFGASVSVYEDNVVIYPVSFKAPEAPLFGHNDHRIVMALSILLTLVGGEIEGAEAIAKSYPGFFGDLRSLGIGVTEYET